MQLIDEKVKTIVTRTLAAIVDAHGWGQTRLHRENVIVEFTRRVTLNIITNEHYFIFQRFKQLPAAKSKRKRQETAPSFATVQVTERNLSETQVNRK